MLNRIDIHDMVPHETYAKGLRIYSNSDKIVNFDVEEGCEESIWAESEADRIIATVKGSGGNYYDVYVEYNPYEDYLGEVSCTCPAFDTYPGPCKHCVAVLIEYTDYLNESTRFSDDLRKWKKRVSSSMDFNRPQTTPSIKALLGREVLKKTVPVLQRETFGRVKLDPEMRFSHGELKVQFRIGIDHMYVLKDVVEFAEHMKQKADVAYGKKLQFVHTAGSFDADSRKLAEFIVLWTKNNERRPIGSGYGYSYYSAPPKTREMLLNGVELEEFAEAMGARRFTGNVDGFSDSTWQFTEGFPEWSLEIETMDDGIQVTAGDYPMLKGTDNYYCFDEGLIYSIPKKEMEPLEDFFQSIEYLHRGQFFVAREDVPAFCRELLPSLKKKFTINSDDFNESDYGIVPVEFEFYLDAPQKDLITCRGMAVYEDKKYSLYDRETNAEQRDLIKEIEMLTLAASYFQEADELNNTLILDGDEDTIYRFLTQGIDVLEGFGTIFISDSLKKIQIKPAPTVSVGVSLSGDLLNLTLTSGDMSRADLIDVLTRYDKKKKYYRLKNGDFIQLEDEGIETLAELKEGLGLTAKQLAEETLELPKYRALYLDNELRERDSLPVERSKHFKALIRDMKTVEDNDFEIPASLGKVLREYQKRGFLWLKTLAHNGFGGILADDMGLGKTLQVIAFLLSEFQEKAEAERRPSLIVCPASLVYNWQSEIERFAPELKSRVVVGSAAERKALIREIGGGEIVITSYELLRRDVEAYEDVTFGCQVIDEAQYIKNPKTLAAKSVKQISAGFKLALTGTPVENRLSELWSIFDYLMPGFLFSYERFHKELEIPVVLNQEEAALRRLQKMIRPFVLRRLKSEVLHDLPEKIEENLFTKLEGEQQKIYDAHVKELQLMLEGQSDEEFKTSKIQVLAALTRLRQICCDPGLIFENYKGGSNKTDMCMDLLSNAAASGHKILLFSQFTSMFETLEKHLEKEKISYYVLTGTTTKERRSQLVKAFNEDDTSVFLISLKAGGTGLNLTAADIVVHFDPWWNLAVQNQATDRAHRIGQKKVVNVYKLIAQGTIEENILKLQEQKQELAEQLLSGSGMGTASFSKDELLELLG